MAYTSGDLLVRAQMECTTGLVKDRVINDFAFRFPAATTDADVTAAFNAVSAFYRTAQATTYAVGGYISPFVNRSATHKLQAYNITAAGTGSPRREDDWLGPPTVISGVGLPSEVAAVLSFQADQTGIQEEVALTRPKARRRGRIYIGPLTLNTVLSNTPPYYLEPTLFLATLRQAAVALMTDSATVWSVWSRKDQTLRPVVGGWTDNAPDTQRRRGPKASTRVVWS